MSAAIPPIPPIPPIPESPPVSKSFKTRRKSNSLTPKNDNKSQSSLNSTQDMSSSITSDKSSTSSGVLGKLRKIRKGRKSTSSGGASLDGAASKEDLATDETGRRNSLSNSEGGGSQAAYDSDSEANDSTGLLTLSTTQTIPIKISTSIEDPTSTPTKAGASQASVPDTIYSRKSNPSTPNASLRDQSPSKAGGTSPGNSSANILGGIFGIGSGKKRGGGSADTNVAPPLHPSIARSGTEVVDGKRPSTAPGIHLETPTPPTRSATATPTNKGWGASTPPNTFVTPPTPIDPIPESGRSSTPNLGGRRSRNNSIGNNSPKKLHSAAFLDDRSKNPSHPLTPTIEVPTPQPTPNIGANNNGFFSSMFNAAQNAATSLGNTINTSIGPGAQGVQGKGKKGEAGSLSKSSSGAAAAAAASAAAADNASEAGGTQGTGSEFGSVRKPLAVETLGQGELSLDHLGITSSADEGKDVGRKSRSRPGSVGGDSMSGSTRSGHIGLGLSNEHGEDVVKGSTLTLNDTILAGEMPPKTPGYATPPQQYADDDSVSGRQRSNSNRSQPRHPTDTGARRKRGSSAATSTPSLSNAGLPGPPVTRPTGFAVATTKRNRDFHNLFRSVPEDDNLIEDYGCALQKEILLQGRMYVSERHICFNSNIFGWVTTLVISFDEIVAIEKKTTAVVFPNAIVIQTLHARNVFASFISRDSTYDLIVGIWRTTHPGLQTSANGVRLGDAKTSEFGSGSEPGSDDEGSSGSEDGSYSSGGSDGHMIETVDTLIVNKPISKKPSSLNMSATAKAQVDGAAPGTDVAGAGEGFPGPATHGPTKCGDEASHYDKPLCDELIPAPLGKVFAMIFGENSHAFMTRLLVEDEKVLELSIPDNGIYKDGTGDHAGKKTRAYSYIKPLNAPVGPKQTKCNITEVIEQSDFEKAVTVVAHTQTPDVPSGGIFKVLTRYCLTWADGNQTRVVMNCTIEWSGKSWLKGPIEKGAQDGQTNFSKSFVAALRREFSASAAGKKSGKAGKRRRRADKDSAEGTTSAAAPAAAAAKASENSWGLLSPVKPVFDILTSLLGDIPGMIVGILVLCGGMWLGVTTLSSWRGPPMPGSRGAYSHYHSNNMALWNEMWIKEETAIWDWLDDRSRVRQILDGDIVSSEDNDRVQKQRMHDMEKHLTHAEAYYQWEDQRIEEAIRQTEQKLEALKDVVQARKEKRKNAAAAKTNAKKQSGSTNGDKVPKASEEAASIAEEKPVESVP